MIKPSEKTYIKELAKYSDQYVAQPLNSTKIIAVGKTIKQLEKKLEKLKIVDAAIMYVPPIDKVLSPVCL